MNKKAYQQPMMNVVNLQHISYILSGSVNRVSGNAGLNYGGGGSGEAKSRQHSVWDNDNAQDEEE